MTKHGSTQNISEVHRDPVTLFTFRPRPQLDTAHLVLHIELPTELQDVGLHLFFWMIIDGEVQREGFVVVAVLPKSFRRFS